MSFIGGNVEATVQISQVIQNRYGNDVDNWSNVFDKPLTGVLDMVSEGTNNKNLLHRVEDVDYVFICDFFDLLVDGVKLSTENSRMVIDGEVYEVKLYDDPMRLHEHMEIYLKYLGGQ